MVEVVGMNALGPGFILLLAGCWMLALVQGNTLHL